MAFTINSFSHIGQSANSSAQLLQDSTWVGAPNLFTYITTDTQATIAAASYFNSVAGQLKVGDIIRASNVNSSGTWVSSADYTVTAVTVGPTASVTVSTSGGTGDVNGPAASTDNALVRFDGTGGKTIQNSGSTLSDTDLLTTANLILSGLTATTVPYVDGSKQFTSSAVTPTELGYVSGVTSAIQTQIDNITAATTSRAITQVAHGLSAGDIVYLNGANYAKAQADAAATAEVVGIVSAVAGVDDFTVQFAGYVAAAAGLTGMTAGAVQYLDPDTAGGVTETEPTTAGQVVKPVLIADSATTAYWINQRGRIV